MDDLYGLVDIMKVLRGKTGCPWDREQTHASLKPYLVEETYEVIEAIDKKDDDELKGELGDLLLQIIFHAQIAAEEKRFTIDDVARAIIMKLEHRHPHVFGKLLVKNSDEVLHNWEKIKKGEGKGSVLDGVPNGLPALLKARRVQEKVKRVGFDWEDERGPFEKVIEEMNELKTAVQKGNVKKIDEEFGDILFSLVNLSRFLNIDAEESLRRSVKKFIERFRYVEDRIAQKADKPITNHTLNELDTFWEESKESP